MAQRRFKLRARVVLLNHQDGIAIGRHEQDSGLNGSAKIEEICVLQNKGAIKFGGNQLGLEPADALIDFRFWYGIHFLHGQ
jgi:hypothetical protein